MKKSFLGRAVGNAVEFDTQPYRVPVYGMYRSGTLGANMNIIGIMLIPACLRREQEMSGRHRLNEGFGLHRTMKDA